MQGWMGGRDGHHSLPCSPARRQSSSHGIREDPSRDHDSSVLSRRLSSSGQRLSVASANSDMSSLSTLVDQDAHDRRPSWKPGRNDYGRSDSKGSFESLGANSFREKFRASKVRHMQTLPSFHTFQTGWKMAKPRRRHRKYWVTYVAALLFLLSIALAAYFSYSRLVTSGPSDFYYFLPDNNIDSGVILVGQVQQVNIRSKQIKCVLLSRA